MRYIVLVESVRDPSRFDSRRQHRLMYDGDSLEMARQLKRHYTRPIDSISAEVYEVTPEPPGLGWHTAHVVKE